MDFEKFAEKHALRTQVDANKYLEACPPMNSQSLSRKGMSLLAPTNHLNKLGSWTQQSIVNMSGDVYRQAQNALVYTNVEDFSPNTFHQLSIQMPKAKYVQVVDQSIRLYNRSLPENKLVIKWGVDVQRRELKVCFGSYPDSRSVLKNRLACPKMQRIFQSLVFPDAPFDKRWLEDFQNINRLSGEKWSAIHKQIFEISPEVYRFPIVSNGQDNDEYLKMVFLETPQPLTVVDDEFTFLGITCKAVSLSEDIPTMVNDAHVQRVNSISFKNDGFVLKTGSDSLVQQLVWKPPQHPPSHDKMQTYLDNCLHETPKSYARNTPHGAHRSTTLQNMYGAADSTAAIIDNVEGEMSESAAEASYGKKIRETVHLGAFDKTKQGFVYTTDDGISYGVPFTHTSHEPYMRTFCLGSTTKLPLPNDADYVASFEITHKENGRVQLICLLHALLQIHASGKKTPAYLIGYHSAKSHLLVERRCQLMAVLKLFPVAYPDAEDDNVLEHERLLKHATMVFGMKWKRTSTRREEHANEAMRGVLERAASDGANGIALSMDEWNTVKDALRDDTIIKVRNNYYKPMRCKQANDMTILNNTDAVMYAGVICPLYASCKNVGRAFADLHVFNACALKPSELRRCLKPTKNSVADVTLVLQNGVLQIESSSATSFTSTTVFKYGRKYYRNKLHSLIPDEESIEVPTTDSGEVHRAYYLASCIPIRFKDEDDPLDFESDSEDEADEALYVKERGRRPIRKYFCNRKYDHPLTLFCPVRPVYQCEQTLGTRPDVQLMMRPFPTLHEVQSMMTFCKERGHRLFHPTLPLGNCHTCQTTDDDQC